MFDYEMLCKGQKTDFCQCNEDQLYQIKDGEFLRFDKTTGEFVTEEEEAGDGKIAIALIIASCAVVLVAIAIILVVVLFICRYR